MMFNLADYGSLISSQKYYIRTDLYSAMGVEEFITRMMYTNFEKNIEIHMSFNGNIGGYTGDMSIDDKSKPIAMRSLDNPLQRYIMKYKYDGKMPVRFYRYDNIEEGSKDDCDFIVPLLETKDKSKDFLLSVSKYHTIGIDKNNYAALYNTKNRIYEKYYVLDNNNIGYFTCDIQEQPYSFTFYDSEKYKLTTITLLTDEKDIPYYMMSPNWYRLSKDRMRNGSDKFDVISFPGKSETISFGPIGIDPFDLNNNDPNCRVWFADKICNESDNYKTFQRNIFRIDEDKEESLYKKLEDFYIVKSS